MTARRRLVMLTPSGAAAGPDLGITENDGGTRYRRNPE